MSVMDSPINLNESAGLLQQALRGAKGASSREIDADRPSFAGLFEELRRIEPRAEKQRAEAPPRDSKLAEIAEDTPERPAVEKPTEDRAASGDAPTRAENETETPRAEADPKQREENEPAEQQEPPAGEPVDQDGESSAAALAVTTGVNATLDTAKLGTAAQTNPSTAAAAGQTASAQLAPQQATATQGHSATPGVAIVETAGAAGQSQNQPGTNADAGGQADKRDGQSLVQAMKASAEAASAAKPAATAASTGSPAAVDASTSSAPTQLTARIATPSATPAAGPQAAADNSAAGDPNVARVSRGLTTAIAQRGGSVTLRLTPVDMGTVRIQMQMTGTTLSASFHAESASAQTLLSQQLSSLRQSLEGQGLQVERLTVQSMQAAAGQQSQAGSNAGGQSQHDPTGQQQSANDGRSRGQYNPQGGGRRDQPGDSTPRGFSDHFDPQSAADAA